MGFFDLNIPYHESDRNLGDKNKSTLKAYRLKLTIKAAELGYTGVAYNREIKGVMSEADRCSISLFPLSSLLKAAPSLSTSVKFHRELLKVPVSTPFRQYTRLTVAVDSPAQVSALNSGNPILKSYDIVAVRPMNQNAFEQACQTSEVDVIAIDFSEKLLFRLKQPVINAAIKRGLCFEITYSSLTRDAPARRQIISNAKLLVDWTRGKNLIVASAAPSVSEIRGPYDVANLLSLVGLSCERAKMAVSKNCRSVIAKALRKKQYYKEAIKVEVMPSNGQFDSKELEFDDWLKWDPISSGEGDLLMDDIEKSFSVSATVTSAVNRVRLVSALDGLPSHGLQIKDVMPTLDTTLEPQVIGKILDDYQEIDVPVAVNGTSEESFYEEGQNFLKNRHPGLSHEDSDISLLNHSSGKDCIHVEGNCDHLVAFEELRTSKKLDACSSPPETEFHTLQSCSENCDMDAPFADGATACRCEIDTETIQTCHGFTYAETPIHLEDTAAPSNLEESKMSISFPVGLHVEALSEEEDNKSGTECKNDKELSLELRGVLANEELKENEQFQTKKEQLPSLVDDLQCLESYNQTKEKSFILGDKIEPMQEEALENQMKSKNSVAPSCHIRGESLSGRVRGKRRMSYQPFLSPFRNLLMSRPSKKKVRKLNPI